MDGLSLYEYVGSRPLQMVDPVGYCSCTPEEVKEKFLAKVKVNVAPGSVQVNVDRDQECEKSADIGRLCTATVNYIVTQPQGWDPQKPDDPTKHRLTLVTKCSAHLVLFCECDRISFLGWTLWSNYYWDYMWGTPEALSAEVFALDEWWEFDEDVIRLRRLRNKILGGISPNWKDWPSWIIDPYYTFTKVLGFTVVRSTEFDDFLQKGKYHQDVHRLNRFGPGKAAQQFCVGDEE